MPELPEVETVRRGLEHLITGYRIAAAPIEDLLFGFALVLSVMGLWEFWGRRGFQREKKSR